MTWLLENLPQVLLVAGLALLIMDALIFGFSTFIFTFLGGSLLITGISMWLGLLPATWVAAAWSNALVTAVLALLLWKPLRRLQNQPTTTAINNDFARQQWLLVQDVDIQGLSTHAYSGVQWKLKSEQPISAGTLVEVFKSEVGTLWVRPVIEK